MGKMNVNFQANLVSKTEIRTTAGKKPVINLSLAVNSRIRNENGEWVDGESYFVRAVAFDRLAEHIDKSLNIGDPVIGAGTLKKARTWTDKNGVEHNNDTELLLDYIGVDLNRRDTTTIKPDYSGGNGATTRSTTARPPKAAAPAPAAAPATDDVFDEFGGDEGDPFADF